MDRHLTFGGRAVYLIAQCAAITIGLLRALCRETPTDAAVWFSSALIAAGILLLASIIRMLGGNTAGAIGAIVISLHPELAGFSRFDALSFCGLSALMFLLTVRNRRGRGGNLPLAVSSAILIVLASLTGMLFPVSLSPRGPLHYFLSSAHVFLDYVGVAPGHFEPLLALESGVTLWWLYASIHSRNSVSLSLTAIPVVYLLCGSLASISIASYARPAHPILLANLVALLALWWRGRTNKRMLDSTTN